MAEHRGVIRAYDFSNHPIRFGVADSDLQVIGEQSARELGSASETMWDFFARARELPSPRDGCRRYERWREDVDLMVHLGVRHYRTSVAWSRVLDEHGRPNQEGIAWYREFFAELVRQGISLYATLYHWELPQTIAAKGGWRRREIVDEFRAHCRVVHDLLGEYITEYFVFNEPSCAALFGHFRGIHAPGERDLAGALLAAHHMLLAQGTVIRDLKQNGARVSTVVNIQPAYAASLDMADLTARQRSDEHWNRWFLDPLFRGEYPEGIRAVYGGLMPAGYERDLETIRAGGEIHALGINYYNGEVAAAESTSELGFKRISEHGPTNELGWPVFAPPYQQEGLYDALRELYHRYERDGLKRLAITETGLASSGRGGDACDDEDRINFLHEHLVQTAAALRSGIPVEAFFVWSFCDSYEWQDGHRPESRFGLVHVVPGSFDRKLKKSATWYREFLASRRIESLRSIRETR